MNRPRLTPIPVLDLDFDLDCTPAEAEWFARGLSKGAPCEDDPEYTTHHAWNLPEESSRIDGSPLRLK